MNAVSNALILRRCSAILVVMSLSGAVTYSHGAEDRSKRKAGGATAEQRVDMGQVRKMVAKHLASQPGYEPGFLISKSNVAPIFAALRKAGWPKNELDRAFAEVLDDSHFLVTQLRSPKGLEFMRRTRTFQMNYDRLDRVSQSKGGKDAITDTVNIDAGPSFWNPNAKPGFSNTARMLPFRGGKRRSASEFSKPTGKIYTEDQLIKRLSTIHQMQKKPAEAATSRHSSRNASSRNASSQSAS